MKGYDEKTNRKLNSGAMKGYMIAKDTVGVARITQQRTVRDEHIMRLTMILDRALHTSTMKQEGLYDTAPVL